MENNHRKLISDSISDLCSSFCDPTRTNIGTCPTQCFSICQSLCGFRTFIPPPCPPPRSIDHPPNKPHKLNPALIISLVILSSTFLLVNCYAAIYVYYYSRRRSHTQRSQSQPQSDETHEEFLDADHGPVLDHPIWYIRTVGLQPSIINSITVCNYKRGEGLVEGTECSVCLNEFQEDETLRLLPKCSHAFHIPCIDTWLRSHTNCPLCRAGIISNATFAPSPEPNVVNPGSVEETHEGILENDEQFLREREDAVCELGIGTEEEGELQVENERKRHENMRGEVDDIQPMRRSVSMDSISASKISVALANVLPEGSDGNSENGLVKVNELNIDSVQKRIGGNQSLLRFMGSSSMGRSLQNGPISMKRSISYSGKFLLSRYSQSRDSVVNL